MEHNCTYVKVNIQIEENRWNVGEKELFEVVIRKNKKRSFLFASKVLGKYIAVHPYTPMLISMILAEIFKMEVENEGFYEEASWRLREALKGLRSVPNKEAFEALKNASCELKKNTLFIGFAETATALGQGVFSAFKSNCTYLHTTRMPISEEGPTLFFKEEHSHAVHHTCYGREIEDWDIFERIVLVDDEITTGKTALNLIKVLTQQTKIKEFVVISILDWRSTEDQLEYERLEEALGIKILCISLLKGSLSIEVLKDMDTLVSRSEKLEWLERNKELVEYNVKDYEEDCEQASKDRSAYPLNHTEKICSMQKKWVWNDIFVSIDEQIILETMGSDKISRKLGFIRKATGRFGVTAKENKWFEEKAEAIGKVLGSYRQYKNCLCLGTEEFIYIPCLIASTMGDNVKFECSARSPIITMNESEYALTDAICFENPEDTALLSYIYNLEGKGYEEVFWILERNIEDAFKERICQAFMARGINAIHFVIFNKGMQREMY